MKKNSKETKKTRFWIIVNTVLVVIVVILLTTIYFSYGKKKSSPQAEAPIETELESELVRRNLDGVWVDLGKENPYPIGVMIDNSPDARPQAGIAKANLVIEAEAEGGITRYLAFFVAGEEIEKIGPVRSARPYFVDWAQELSAVYTHCGGSPEALVKISREGIIDLNEFYKGSYFWRDQNLLAPHNIFTSSEKLDEFVDQKDLREDKFFSWNFKDDAPVQDRADSNEIKIGYQIRSSNVTWEFNKDKNDYLRYLGDRVSKDASGEEVRAKNIVIQTIDAREIDDKLRLEMDYIGEGDVVVCFDGYCQKGIWKKKNASARTRFYKEDSSEFEFNAGTTWIEVVRPEIEVSY